MSDAIKKQEQAYRDLVGGAINRLVEQVDTARATWQFIDENRRFPGYTEGKMMAICDEAAWLETCLEKVYAEVLYLKEKFEDAE